MGDTDDLRCSCCGKNLGLRERNVISAICADCIDETERPGFWEEVFALAESIKRPVYDA